MKVESIKPQSLVAVLEDRRDFNEKFVEYHFELKNPPNFNFEAGQFVSVKINADGVRRSYSIASPPSFNHGFKLLVDLSPGGVGSQFFRSLLPGTRVDALGPMGNFKIAKKPSS